MGTVVNYKNILATLEDNVQLNISLDDIISIASGYRKSMENFQQFYVEGQEVYIDEIYYYYASPEERLRLSNILRTELELPAASLADISTSINEPYFETQPYSDDSSSTDALYDSSTYGQSDVYTPNYSDPYSEESYTEYYDSAETGTYYEEDVYESTYDSSY
jgi:hypothetical protein